MSSLSHVEGRHSGYGSQRYLNREYSWLMFNRRVLAEAENPENPLLERLKFLAIFESNLDEFYMVRVSGLIEQYESGIMDAPPDGLSPNEQLMMISETAFPMRTKAARLYAEVLEPALRNEGIVIRQYSELSEKQQQELTTHFRREVFPLCTPLVVHPSPSVLFISNRSLNLAVHIVDEDGDPLIARVKIPNPAKRLVRLPRKRNEFVLIEDVIANNLEFLFPGAKVQGSYLFRVLRDADVEIRELEAADLITSVENTLKLRRFGDPVLLEASDKMPPAVRRVLMEMHALEESDVMLTDGLMGFDVFWEIAELDKPALRFPSYIPHSPEALTNSETMFDLIRRHDVLIHHPYDSFRAVENFVSTIRKDPQVVGIKQTLYRVGKESPIVESLQAGAESGKQATAMVELKARFDESNNLEWARQLERSGVHVTYGFPEYKTHCKLCLIVRREGETLRTYAHIGTGNYNPATSRLYTDLGLFTSDPDITQDVSELFNYLTGYSRKNQYRKLLVAPLNLREGIVERIQREIEIHKKSGGGVIRFKLNALVDPEVIEALYEASGAGVRVELVVRGVCCLRPGVEGMSENIVVASIVGRFLEHSRIYFFGNGGKPEAFIGSADMMRRNLDRRIEVLAPVEDRKLVGMLAKVFDVYLADNSKAWVLLHDGRYVRREEAPPFSAQDHFMQNPPSKGLLKSWSLA